MKWSKIVWADLLAATKPSWSTTKFVLLALVCSIPLFSQSGFAATHYILPQGSGSHSGADWGNACNAFSGACSPSSLVRGDTYYVGSGSYASQTFNTPESGTSVITVKGATAADHGTATGWSNSLGVDVTSASFPSIAVFNGYTTLDGNTGSGTTGSSYGFTIPAATSCTGDISAIFLGPGGSTMHNVQISHFYLPGCVADTQTIAIQLQTTTTPIGFTYSHNYIDKWQVAIFDLDSQNLTVDHNIITNGQSYSDHHGNLIDLLDSAKNITISNNTLINCEGTVCMGANDTGATCAGGVSGAIYGNVFATASNIGNGIVGATTRCYFTNTLVYNNTFTGTTTNIPWFQGCVDGAATCSSATGNVAENNIVWSAACSQGAAQGVGVNDYNSYLSCIDTPPSEAHGQIANLNPFVNASANNYLPAAAPASCASSTSTCAGLSLSAPYTVDSNGNPRTVNGLWQRGAFAFVGLAAGGPAPPTGLTASTR
jgi:pectate lyase